MSLYMVSSLSWLSGNMSMSSSCMLGMWLCLLGYVLLVSGGNLGTILGIFSVGLGSAFWLSMWSISLLLVSSLIGFMVIVWLFRFFSAPGIASVNAWDVMSVSALSLLCMCAAFSGDSMSVGTLSLPSFVYLSSVLSSIVWLSLLCLMVWMATLLLVHMCTKVMYYSVRMSICVMSYLLFDGILLLILGVILCLVPILLRRWMSMYSEVTGSIREMIYRWTGDVYECGITSTGSSRHDLGMSSELGLGMIRLLSYVYLFLLLDLEASVMLVGFYGGCLPFYLLCFMSCVVLSLGCELSKDPLF
jgi:hypothetical protein